MSRTSEKRAHRAAQRKSQQPNDLWSGNRRTALIGGGVVVLILAAFWLTNTLNTPQPAVTPVAAGTASATTAAPVGIGTVVSVPSLGGTHVNPGERHAAYNSTPPTSGPHYGTPANWGKYEQGLAEETWIHNLEHGGIVALYNCPQGCPELVSKLEGLLKTGPPSSFGYVKLIITPYSKIPNKLTLVAWQFYLPLNDYDDTAIRNFFKDHQDQGPEPGVG